MKELQEELYSVGFDSDELCPLIEKYIGHFKRRYMTSIEKYIILGLAFFHLSKELFQMAQVDDDFMAGCHINQLKSANNEGKPRILARTKAQNYRFL